MRQLTIRLSESDAAKLIDLARQQRRTPRAEATRLLADAIEVGHATQELLTRAAGPPEPAT